MDGDLIPNWESSGHPDRIPLALPRTPGNDGGGRGSGGPGMRTPKKEPGSIPSRELGTNGRSITDGARSSPCAQKGKSL